MGTKVGRNEACPCKSGRKFKRCHGGNTPTFKNNTTANERDDAKEVVAESSFTTPHKKQQTEPRAGDDGCVNGSRLLAVIPLAESNTRQFLSIKSLGFDRVVEIDRCITKALLALTNPKPPEPSFMLPRAHASWIAGIRLATAGQVPESYMAFRGALEGALYAFTFFDDPKIALTWIKRQSGTIERSEAKNAMAYTKIIKRLRVHHEEQWRIVARLYEILIDSGAHPNPDAVFTSMEYRNQGDDVQFKSHYLTSGAAVALAVKTGAQVGISVLELFKLIYPEIFNDQNLELELQRAKRGL